MSHDRVSDEVIVLMTGLHLQLKKCEPDHLLLSGACDTKEKKTGILVEELKGKGIRPLNST